MALELIKDPLIAAASGLFGAAVSPGCIGSRTSGDEFVSAFLREAASFFFGISGFLGSFGLLPRPFDHSLWRAVKEDEFGVKVLLQLQLTGFSHEEDVGAELEDAVDAWKLFEHDGVRDTAEELADEFPDHQHHGCVEAHDTARDTARRY